MNIEQSVLDNILAQVESMRSTVNSMQMSMRSTFNSMRSTINSMQVTLGEMRGVAAEQREIITTWKAEITAESNEQIVSVVSESEKMDEENSNDKNRDLTAKEKGQMQMFSTITSRLSRESKPTGSYELQLPFSAPSVHSAFQYTDDKLTTEETGSCYDAAVKSVHGQEQKMLRYGHLGHPLKMFDKMLMRDIFSSAHHFSSRLKKHPLVLILKRAEWAGHVQGTTVLSQKLVLMELPKDTSNSCIVQFLPDKTTCCRFKGESGNLYLIRAYVADRVEHFDWHQGALQYSIVHIFNLVHKYSGYIESVVEWLWFTILMQINRKYGYSGFPGEILWVSARWFMTMSTDYPFLDSETKHCVINGTSSQIMKFGWDTMYAYSPLTVTKFCRPVNSILGDMIELTPFGVTIERNDNSFMNDVSGIAAGIRFDMVNMASAGLAPDQLHCQKAAIVSRWGIVYGTSAPLQNGWFYTSYMMNVVWDALAYRLELQCTRFSALSIVQLLSYCLSNLADHSHELQFKEMAEISMAKHQVVGHGIVFYDLQKVVIYMLFSLKQIESEVTKNLHTLFKMGKCVYTPGCMTTTKSLNFNMVYLLYLGTYMGHNTSLVE